jgi:glycosyltransferase involved in cell wall biosynthesis
VVKRYTLEEKLKIRKEVGNVLHTGIFATRHGTTKKIFAKLIAKGFPLNLVRVAAVRAAGFAMGKHVYIGEDFLVIDDLDRDACSLHNGNRVAIAALVKLAQAAIERLQAKGIAAELVVAKDLPQTKLVQYNNALILSSISEGSPNIVKETMACNVPVVATNVGDVFEVIGGTEVCSVCRHDPEDLAIGLEQALQHKELTTGRANTALLERSIVAEQVIVVYKQIVSERQKRHLFLSRGGRSWKKSAKS